MAVGKKEDRVSAKVFSCLSFVVAVVLLVVGVVFWKMGGNVVSMVNKSLIEQKIYFPPADSPEFSKEMFPDAQKYAGTQVDDGEKAKAYAEDVLGVKLDLISGGKTGSEINAMLTADPQNVALQKQQTVMFQLGTQKALLMVGGYAGWSQGMMMKSAGMIALVSAAVLLVVGAVQWMRYKKG